MIVSITMEIFLQQCIQNHKRITNSAIQVPSIVPDKIQT